MQPTSAPIAQQDASFQPLATQSNAALDMSNNPYLNGNVQAGSLEGGVQYDEYGRPISPLG